MISGGNATVFVSNMNNAVNFYTQVLGLHLAERYGDHWATVDADGLTIGLHPKSARHPVPGTKGAIMLGFGVDEPLHTIVQKLKDKGVRFAGDIINDEAGSFADFEDPDGNPMYLWETASVPEGAK